MSTSCNSPYYTRVLLKLSGESLMGKKKSGIDPQTLGDIAFEIHSTRKLGTQIAIVVGGGNIFRGIKSSEYNIGRVTSDYMGMLATVINALALKEALNSHGSKTIAMSALNIDKVVEPYNREKALEHINEGKIVIFAGGTGNPYFTTDTAATLRAVETNAQVILKASHIDGVYDQDPLKQPDAKLFEKISFEQVLTNKLGVIDLTAISMAMEHRIPIIVFNVAKKGNIERIVSGHKVGTLITGASNDR
ncbi:MAG TPA: UMP kinase [Desulfatiglandales bacterium]|nr:UMP kinase [Desulfatiglandales bacterium]